jgi:glycosyltransferase involved in cell wall biosynthesis
MRRDAGGRRAEKIFGRFLAAPAGRVLTARNQSESFALILRKTRVAVINTHPIQYFAPLYAHLNATSDIEVTALYLSDFSLRGAVDHGFGQAVAWDVDLLAGYPNRFIGRRWREIEPFGLRATFVPEVFEAVRRGGFDAVWINGHAVAANFLAMAAARMIGAPILMRCDTHLRLPVAPSKRALRRPMLSTLFSFCDAFLAIGSANREFYRAMGAPDEKISLVPFAIDNARFLRDARLSPQERVAVRRRHGLSPERPVVLYASKLQRRKHPDDLLRAARGLAGEGLDFELAIAGSGEMRAELEAMAADPRLSNVVFPGFVNQSEMPKLLGACDIFVLPAEDEPWGLVVNEAMCAGLPIVISRELGCAPDLLRHGENGFGFAAGDVDGLADALRRLIVDASLRASMSRASLSIIGGWDYARCLGGLREALGRLAARREARR